MHILVPDREILRNQHRRGIAHAELLNHRDMAVLKTPLI
jgi:hypothetical protein